jgi:hypothetical protein
MEIICKLRKNIFLFLTPEKKPAWTGRPALQIYAQWADETGGGE